jgi:hypothetical protein
VLSLEHPAIEVDALLAYADHASATHWYFAAPPPRLARSGGRTMFDVYSYAVDLEHSPLAGTSIPDELGAGFLSMGAECVLSAGQRSRLVAAIAKRTGIPADTVSLSPIPYTRGKATVLALDAISAPAGPAPADPGSATPLRGRPTFVERVIGTGTPSLLGPLTTIFSLALSRDGVVFLRDLYQQGAAPVGLVLELSFDGLRPSVSCRIRADLRAIRDHFGGGLALQYAWARAEVEAGLDHLAETSSVQIELTSEQTGEAAQKSKELALSLFKDRIVQELFRPTAPAAAVPQLPQLPGQPTGNQTATTGALVGLTLKATRSEELKTVTYDFTERAPETRTHCPQGFLPALLTPAELGQHVHHVDLGGGFFEQLQVLFTGPAPEEFAALSLRQVDADIVYGGDGDPVPPARQTLTFRPDSSGDKSIALKRRGRPTLAYATTLRYDFARSGDGAAEQLQYELPARASARRTQRINPFEDFRVETVELEDGRLDPSIEQVDVDLDFALPDGSFSARRKIRLTPGQPAADPADRRWHVRTLAGIEGTLQARNTFYFPRRVEPPVTGDPGSPRVIFDQASWSAPAEPVLERLLRVDDPFASARRRLRIDANVTSPDLTEILVEVDYDDQVAGYRRTLTVELAPDPVTGRWAAATAEWPILDPDRQQLRYRVTVHEGGLVAEPGEWQTTDEPSVTVGGASSRVRVVEVRLIGPTPADAGLDGLQVNIKPAGTDDPAVQQLLFDSTSPASQSVRVVVPRGAAPGFRYQTIAFRVTGEIAESGWRAVANPLIVISTRTV